MSCSEESFYENSNSTQVSSLSISENEIILYKPDILSTYSESPGIQSYTTIPLLEDEKHSDPEIFHIGRRKYDYHYLTECELLKNEGFDVVPVSKETLNQLSRKNDNQMYFEITSKSPLTIKKRKEIIQDLVDFCLKNCVHFSIDMEKESDLITLMATSHVHLREAPITLRAMTALFNAKPKFNNLSMKGTDNFFGYSEEVRSSLAYRNPDNNFRCGKLGSSCTLL